MSAPLQSETDQRSARNLLAWADRILRGEHGAPGSSQHESAVWSWHRSYKSFRDGLPPLEPR